jgi:cystathionine beta-synthase
VPYKVEGIGQDKVPGTLDMSVVDDFVTVSDKESFAMARRLTREEGLFAGGSSGLIVHVALQLAKKLDDPGALVVAALPDTGERYLSKLYNDEWMRENQMLDADRTTLGHVLRGKTDHKADIVSLTPGQTVRQALHLMRLHDVSQLPVMDGSNCVGSVSDWSLSARSLENTRLLDVTVSEVMDPPFPIVEDGTAAEGVAKLLSKSNPAVLVRSNGRVTGIVTRSDLLSYLMAR